MLVLRNRHKNMKKAKSDQRLLLPSAVLKGEPFGQWEAYGLKHGSSEDCSEGDGVGRAENHLVVVALCFLIGGVNGNIFFTCELALLSSDQLSWEFPRLESRLFFQNM